MTKMSYHSDLDLIRKEQRPWNPNDPCHTFKNPSVQPAKWFTAQYKPGTVLKCGHVAPSDGISSYAWMHISDPYFSYCEDCKKVIEDKS